MRLIAGWAFAWLLAAAPALADGALADGALADGAPTSGAPADGAPADGAPAERPQTMPSRDVEIAYTITRGTQTLVERTRWSAAAGTQRVDPPGRNIHLVMDHKQHHAWLVDDDAHTVMEMAPPKLGALEPDSNASFVRHGTATVAGLGCTEWETKSGGPDTILCLTDDGVLLRVQGGGKTLIEATQVTYAANDAAIFVVPTDYTRVTPPPRRGAAGMPQPGISPPRPPAPAPASPSE